VTVTSTVAGGLWHDPATWADGVVPTAADDAVILGEVHVDLSATGEVATCRNLTLDAGAVLRSQPYGYRTVIVHGDLHNEGTVRSGPGVASYDDATLEVEIGGDLYQGGAFGVLETRFIGAGAQNIELGAGVSLGGSFVDVVPSSPLVAAGPLSVSGATFTLGDEAGQGRLDLAGYELTLAAGDLRVAGGVLEVARVTGVAGATLTADALAADDAVIELAGDVRVAATTATGTITVTGSVHVLPEAVLYNQAYTDPVLVITGDVVNEGILRRGPGVAAYGEGNLTVHLGGDLTVGGPYTPTQTFFDGELEQVLTATGENTITGTFTDTTPATALVAGSDLTSSGASFTLGGGRLDLGQHGLTLAAGDLRVAEGTLEVARVTGVEGATLTTDRLVADEDLIELGGDLRVAATEATGTMIVTGSVHVLTGAALYNQGYTDPTLVISGSLVNDGVVRWGPGYAAYGEGTLTVHLDGDLTLGGPYTPTQTFFDGEVAQALTTTGGTVVTGTFSDTTPTTALVAGGDLVIGEAVFNLGSAEAGGSLDFGDFALSHLTGTLSFPYGTVLVDTITGSTDNAATFAIAAIQPPSGTLTLHEHVPTGPLAVDGNLVVAAGAVLHNAYNVQAYVTVSGTTTLTGIAGTGQGYASYDEGHLYLNGLEQPGWAAE